MSLTTEQLDDFHAELVALQKAGYPIEIQLLVDDGTEIDGPHFPSALKEIAIQINGDLQRQLPLDIALEKCTRIRQAYSSVLKTWLATDGSPQSLEPLTRSANARQELAFGYRLTMLAPIILAAVGIVGLYNLLFLTLPHIESLVRQMNQENTLTMQVLTFLQPAFGWAVLLVVLVVVVYVYRVASRRWEAKLEFTRERMPQLEAIRLSSEAEQLARLGARGLPVQQGLMLLESSSSSSGATSPSERPLMRWAIEASNQQPHSVEPMRLVGKIYETLSHAYAEQNIRRWPVIGTLLVGGTFALLLGVGLFLPFVELLMMVIQFG